MNTFDNSTRKTSVQSHDTEAPSNLVNFMLKSWKPRGAVQTPKVKNLANFRRRREALSARFPGELLVIPAGHLKVRSNDTFYPFRPGSDFFYLTGSAEPDCVLALIPLTSGGHRPLLFVEANPGKTDATFFTDRVRGELWEGPGVRLGIPESEAKFGIGCVGLPEMDGTLLQAGESAPKGYRVLRGFSDRIDRLLPGAGAQLAKDREMAAALSEMRLIKDAEEIKELAEVVAITKRGFEDVIRRIKTAKTERELEGVFFTRARMEGNDLGYGSIVASGEHACTLHWKRNDGKLRKGDLLLLDAGVEGHSFYTADITRTLPLSGKFTKEQRAIYELVLAAQQAAMKEVKPGNDFMAPNRTAMKVLAHGLEWLGILPMPADEALDPKNQFYRRYTLHNVSHMLGLDVHDCAQARAEAYKFGQLRAGMVLTVEPGLYFQPDDLTVPARFRGIGIRIEDDVLVTDKGCRNLSSGIPSGAEAVERWMKTLWKR